jgi:hypothetical protein
MEKRAYFLKPLPCLESRRLVAVHPRPATDMGDYPASRHAPKTVLFGTGISSGFRLRRIRGLPSQLPRGFWNTDVLLADGEEWQRGASPLTTPHPHLFSERKAPIIPRCRSRTQFAIGRRSNCTASFISLHTIQGAPTRSAVWNWLAVVYRVVCIDSLIARRKSYDF